MLSFGCSSKDSGIARLKMISFCSLFVCQHSYTQTVWLGIILRTRRRSWSRYSVECLDSGDQVIGSIVLLLGRCDVVASSALTSDR